MKCSSFSLSLSLTLVCRALLSTCFAFVSFCFCLAVKMACRRRFRLMAPQRRTRATGSPLESLTLLFRRGQWHRTTSELSWSRWALGRVWLGLVLVQQFKCDRKVLNACMHVYQGTTCCEKTLPTICRFPYRGECMHSLPTRFDVEPITAPAAVYVRLLHTYVSSLNRLAKQSAEKCAFVGSHKKNTQPASTAAE